MSTHNNFQNSLGAATFKTAATQQEDEQYY